MINRRSRRHVRSLWINEYLEPRLIPSADLVGVVDRVRDLGPISRASAVLGAEAKATIDVDSAVIFRFEIEAGGAYTLLVQHTGTGLSLEAATPAGSMALNPGPVGTVQRLPLELSPGAYEVVATAGTRQAASVDWDLLLNNGVGHGTEATTIPSALPLGVLDAGGTATATAESRGPAAMDQRASDDDGGLASPPAPVQSQAQGQGSMRYAVSGLLGRDTPAETGALPPTLLAGRPEPHSTPAGREFANLDATLVVAIQPGAAVELSTGSSAVASQALEALARGIEEWIPGRLDAGLAASLGDLVASGRGETAPLAPAAELISLTTISSGLVVGAVAVTIGSRARINRKPRLFDRASARMLKFAPEPIVQGLQTLLKRAV